jgi:hypothetical protein
MTDIINIFRLSDIILWRFIVSIILGVVLGVWIAFIYKLTHKGLNYESSFISTLALLAPIVTLVMFFIQGDLVLSLGLVGSLSIIRFRTPIKDTRDMVFLFWTIVVGLGLGTLNWTLSFISTIILSIIMLVFYKIRYGRKKHNEYILMVYGQENFDESIIKDWQNKVDYDIRLRSREIEDNRLRLVYEIRFNEKDIDQINALVKTIQKQRNIEKVSLLSPQLNLPM